MQERREAWGAGREAERLENGVLTTESEPPRGGLMKEDTPIGEFHNNRLKSNGLRREFLRRKA